MASQERAAESAFENEVIRIARWMYPGTDRGGPVIIEGRERDGVFVNDDVAVAIECTVSSRPNKALSDGKKLDNLCRKLKELHPSKEVSGYFITRDEPTPEQRTMIERIGNPLVSALSYSTFRGRLIQAHNYLIARRDMAFGSAKNLASGSATDLGEYFPMDFVAFEKENQITRYKHLLRSIKECRRVIVLGDYGAGKSMTLRQIFLDLAQEYQIGGAITFPVHISLRDHHGQVDPVEALERHARNVGFYRSDQLVRAWRAGYAHIILDGFDEIAPANVGGGYLTNERSAKRASVELVRRFVRETPQSVGVAIAGRRNFFHRAEDLRDSMGLPDDALLVSATDFTDEQVTRYLRRQGWSVDIPQWLPPRPLLLGYLAVKNVLGEVVDSTLAAPEGWDLLLSLTFDREAQIEGNVSGIQLREILERVATKARRTGSGVGPVYMEDVRQSFREVVGFPPDERQEVLLRRLPLLATDDPRTEARKIIDPVLADVARAGDVVRYIEDPYSTNLPSDDWQQLLEGVGIESAAHKLHTHGGAAGGLVKTALAQTVKRSEASPPLAVDLLSIALELRVPIIERIYVSNLTISELHTPSGVDLSSVEFQDCFFGRLDIGGELQHLPRFYRCDFLQIEGLRSKEELPVESFTDCDFGDITKLDTTTDSLMDLPHSPAILVALTILKKLYAQQGTGRKDSALRRGLPPAFYRLVDPVIGELVRSGLMVSSRRSATKVWVPVRAQRSRVSTFIDAASRGDWPSSEDLPERLSNIE
ncbi:NACHT domain-containing protein [Actinokineospora fastidiosa]|uniref:NACHT domain-containing protein n=1 Tax=Actinokineospora fastidiosa TaxID=1816 RepID=A0A918GA02_9PSEU|nr:NACHT domain-containing protein [Actinokineospora fastidiosa]GGS25313.1 hypothetical protein GCM10010171_18280 [Actinokineospora fastidiosa]